MGIKKIKMNWEKETLIKCQETRYKNENMRRTQKKLTKKRRIQ